MTAHTFDWSRFVVRISVKAPDEKLYNAWATRDGIESWFLRLSEFKSRVRSEKLMNQSKKRIHTAGFGTAGATILRKKEPYWIAMERIILNSVLEKRGSAQ